MNYVLGYNEGHSTEANSHGKMYLQCANSHVPKEDFFKKVNRQHVLDKSNLRICVQFMIFFVAST